MAITASKPAINIREKLNELKQDTGLKGQELMRAETVAEARTAIGAGRKNLIINGGMQISQRGTSFTAQAFTLDRWYLNLSGGSATVTWNEFTRGSELDGIKNYLKLNVTTGDNYIGMVYKVEGARALPTGKATLSWWAKGVNPASGEIVCNMQLINNGSTNFNTPLADTFSVTSEWQKYTRTVDIPDYTGMGSETSAGSWTYLRFSQETGDTSTAAWSLDITGVQLEVGSVATDFEHRSYGEELALCQRYYEKSYPPGSYAGDNEDQGNMNFTPISNQDRFDFIFGTPMRDAPDITLYRKNGGALNQAQRADNSGSYINITLEYTHSKGFGITSATSFSRNYRFHYIADAEL
jgi:hypothetical protein